MKAYIYVAETQFPLNLERLKTKIEQLGHMIIFCVIDNRVQGWASMKNSLKPQKLIKMYQNFVVKLWYFY